MKLRISNFLEIQEAELVLEDKFTLVYGENRLSSGAASNGAGKSLFLEAIYFALYGTTLRGFKLADVVGPFSDSAEVELEISDLRILRSRTKQKSSVKVWLDGIEQKYQEIKYAQDDIDNWVGANQSHFLVSSYFGEQSEHILDMTPTARTKKLLEIVKYDEQSHNAIDQKLKKLIDGVQLKIELIDGEYHSLSEIEERAKQAEYAGVRAALTLCSECEIDIRKKRERKESAVNSMSDYMSSLGDDYVDKLRSSKDELAKLESTLTRIKFLRAEKVEELSYLKSQTAAVVAEVARVQSEIDSAVESIVKPVRTELNETRALLEKVKITGKATVEKKNRLVEMIKQEAERLESFEGSSKEDLCPTCGQALHDESSHAEVNKSRSEIKSRLTKLKDDLASVEAELSSLRVERDSLIEKLDNCSHANDNIHEVCVAAVNKIVYNSTATLEVNLVNDRYTISDDSAEALNASIKKLSDKVAEVKRDIDTGDAKVVEVKSFIKSCTVSEEKITSLSEEIESIDKQLVADHVLLEKLKKKLAVAERDYEKKLEEISAEFETRIEKLVETKDGWRKIHEIATAYRQSLSKFRMSIISQFMSRLEGRLNHFFSEIGSDLYASFSMNGEEIEILFGDDSKSQLLPYKFFSRGERTRLRKAFFWLMIDLFNPKIVLSDESVDGVDEFGIAAIANFSAKENANRIYLEASPLPLAFSEQPDVQRVLCVKDQVDGKTSISISTRN